MIPRHALSLAAVALLASGCASLDSVGGAKFFSNRPDGPPLFRIASGPRGMTIAALEPGGGYTEARPMRRVARDEPPFTTTPGLSEIVKSAHRVDDYVFLEFNDEAQFGGQPVPTRYFLLPGGFAFQVDPPRRPGR